MSLRLFFLRNLVRQVFSVPRVAYLDGVGWTSLCPPLSSLLDTRLLTTTRTHLLPLGLDDVLQRLLPVTPKPPLVLSPAAQLLHVTTLAPFASHQQLRWMCLPHQPTSILSCMCLVRSLPWACRRLPHSVPTFMLDIAESIAKVIAVGNP